MYVCMYVCICVRVYVCTVQYTVQYTTPSAYSCSHTHTRTCTVSRGSGWICVRTCPSLPHRVSCISRSSALPNHFSNSSSCSKSSFAALGVKFRRTDSGSHKVHGTAFRRIGDERTQGEPNTDSCQPARLLLAHGQCHAQGTVGAQRQLSVRMLQAGQPHKELVEVGAEGLQRLEGSLF